MWQQRGAAVHLPAVASANNRSHAACMPTSTTDLPASKLGSPAVLTTSACTELPFSSCRTPPTYAAPPPPLQRRGRHADSHHEAPPQRNFCKVLRRGGASGGAPALTWHLRGSTAVVAPQVFCQPRALGASCSSVDSVLGVKHVLHCSGMPAWRAPAFSPCIMAAQPAPPPCPLSYLPIAPKPSQTLL